jgi:hypothetical protein
MGTISEKERNKKEERQNEERLDTHRPSHGRS